MDMSLVGVASTAISLAKEMTKTAVGIRDFNHLATVVSQIQDQLLKAQDSLFAHNSQLLVLQQEHFDNLKKLRELEEALNDWREYSLVEIGGGYRAYQRNAAAVPSGEVSPVPLDPPQYLCQPCFEGKRLKATLQPTKYMGAPTGLECRVCHERFVFKVSPRQQGPDAMIV